MKSQKIIVSAIIFGLVMVGVGYFAGSEMSYDPTKNSPDTVVKPANSIAEANPGIAGFSFKSIKIDGGQLNYYEGGSGEPLVLLHGWPQSAYAWHKVAPRLAGEYRVIIPNLPGIAGSDVISGSTKTDMAKDIHTLMTELGISSIRLAGHDLGGMVAHAYMVDYPKEVSHVAILEIVIPGLAPWDLVQADPRVWHFAFHNVDGLPEKLIQGKQREYFDYFFDTFVAAKDAITPDERNTYVAAYQSPASLKASLDWYRAFGEDAETFSNSKTRIEARVLLAGGDKALGALLPIFVEGYAQHNIENIETHVFENSGHMVMAEKPEEVSNTLLSFLKN